MSEGEAAHLGWVMAHPARARRRVRAARDFISPEAAGAPIYLYSEGAENLKEAEWPLPVPFWWVGVAALSLIFSK